MTSIDLPPDISNLSIDELVARRAAIDSLLEEKRSALLVEAERLGDLIANGNKRRSRKPKPEDNE